MRKCQTDPSVPRIFASPHSPLRCAPPTRAKYVLILSGDHVSRIDYSDILRRHETSKADVTVACMEVGLQKARLFGVLTLDSGRHIRDFKEKPETPRPIPGNADRAMASIGIYIFSVDVLCRALIADISPSTRIGLGLKSCDGNLTISESGI